MGLNTGSDTPKFYIKANKGLMYYLTDEKDKEGIVETYVNKNGETKTIFKRILKYGISGRLISADVKKNKFKQIELVLLFEDNGLEMQYSTPAKGNNFLFIVNQLMVTDTTRMLTLNAGEDKKGYTSIFIKHGEGKEAEWVGIKYSKKNGNIEQVPKAIETEDEAGDTKWDFSEVNKFYSTWIREELAPRLQVSESKKKEDIYVPDVKDDMEEEAEDTINEETIIEDIDGDDLPF